MPELTTSNTRGKLASLILSRLHKHWRYAFAALTGLLMALSVLEPSFYLLAWFCLVPLLFAVKGLSLRQCYAVSLFAGLVLYLCSCYWVLPFIMNMKGYSILLSALISFLYWAYSAQVIAVVMVLWGALSKQNLWQRLLLFPLLFVAAYAIFPNVIPVQLAMGQSHNLLALQATDMFGIYGLDFALALSNICIYQLLNLRDTKSTLLPFIVPALFFSLWFAYGYYHLADWEQRQLDWPSKKIGLVQPNDQASIAIPAPQAGYGWSYPPEMEMTERLVESGAEIVFWPESRYKGFFDSDYVRAAYRQRVKQLATPLIMQDLEKVTSKHSDSGRTETYNTLFMLSDQGELASIYRKQKRIAFGEYMPLIERSPLMRSWVQTIVGDFLANISAGQKRSVFSAAGMSFIPLICFEVIFPEFVADAVSQSASGGVLVTASFDAWFGQSHAPFQHLGLSRIRAVENRLPLVHVINNGPSAVIMPSGRILAQTEAFKKQAAIVDMPYSERSGGSFFSRQPRLFIYGVYALLIFLILGQLKNTLVRRRAA